MGVVMSEEGEQRISPALVMVAIRSLKKDYRRRVVPNRRQSPAMVSPQFRTAQPWVRLHSGSKSSMGITMLEEGKQKLSPAGL